MYELLWEYDGQERERKCEGGRLKEEMKARVKEESVKAKVDH